MFTRRLLIAQGLTLPVLLVVPALAQSAGSPAETLAAALVTCWQARGIRFTLAQVVGRIGPRSGRAALLAVAGATEAADGEEVETAVEILWEAGAAPSPAQPLLARDLGKGLPLLLISSDGRALLLHAMDGGTALASDPLTGQRLSLPISHVALIGRPVISGA